MDGYESSTLSLPSTLPSTFENSDNSGSEDKVSSPSKKTTATVQASSSPSAGPVQTKEESPSIVDQLSAIKQLILDLIMKRQPELKGHDVKEWGQILQCRARFPSIFEALSKYGDRLRGTANIYLVHVLKEETSLITAFVRLIDRAVPEDVVSLVMEFYSESVHSLKPCDLCNSRGYKSVSICLLCRGSGSARVHCRDCLATGYWTAALDCAVCEGSGSSFVQMPCSECFCRKCAKNGQIMGDCSECEGRGRSASECPPCSGSGVTWVRSGCAQCGGTGKFIDHTLCRSCYGWRQHDAPCWQCVGEKYVFEPCGGCSGQKEIAFLDLHKMCKQHSRCEQCLEYFPNNMIVDWSQCGHHFCTKCVTPYIEGEIKGAKQIPQCLRKGCGCELAVDDVSAEYSETLRILHFAKYWFPCSAPFCDELHENREMVRWAGCSHQYGRECAQIMLLGKEIQNVSFDDICPGCGML